MGFFKRRSAVAAVHPVTGFWQWWTSYGAAAFDAALTTGQWGNLPDEMSAQLAAVHPGLAWDTGPGRTARNLLTVSPEGDAALRRLAEQWLRAAPAAGASWEFAAARQPVRDVIDNTIEVDGHSLHLGDARFSIVEDSEREVLDIAVYHPLFSTMSGQGPLQVSFLLLDWLLGEDGVERCVGAIDATDSCDAARATAADLMAAVSALEAQQQSDIWVVMEGRNTSGERLIVSALRPLRWIDHPLFDLLSAVQLPYLNKRDDGLPTAASLDALRRIEDDISAALGIRGLLVAHETAGGVRTLYYYSDSEDQNGRDVIDIAAHIAGGTTQHSVDPGWTQVRPFS